MQTPSSSSSDYRVVRIENPQAIAFLIEAQELRWLQPFFYAERNLAQVAHELEVDLSFLSRKAQRMVGLGLLEICRTEQRKGRAIRYYRVTADEFFIPEHTGAISTMLENNDRIRNKHLQTGILEEWMSREDPANSEWGLQVKYFEHGVGITAAIRPGVSWNAVASNVLAAAYWRTPKLNQSDAQWLKFEIERISEELRLRHCEDGESFLVRLAFAPQRV